MVLSLQGEHFVAEVFVEPPQKIHAFFLFIADVNSGGFSIGVLKNKNRNAPVRY